MVNLAYSIRVFLLLDHQIFLEGLVRLIQDHPFMEVVGHAKDGHETLKQLQACQPDVILLDVMMPNLNELETIRLITEASLKTKVLILIMHWNEEFIKKALKTGAAGYLLKDST